MRFRAWGHSNILATHATTFEFTKDSFVTSKGDCIVGVKADYDLVALKEIAQKSKKVMIKIRTGNVEDSIIAVPNKDFSDDKELVVRLGDFASPRTFATNADKAAKHLNPELIKAIKMGSSMEVTIEEAIE